MLWLHRQTSQRLFDGTEKPHGSSSAGTLNSTSWSLEPMRSKQSFLHRWLSASSSSVPQSVTEINIFISGWKLHLDFLWVYMLPASGGNHFFLFYMGLANGSWCWKSSSPNNRDCTFQGKVISSSSLLFSINFLLPNISTKVEDKLCSGKVTQILSWKTNFLALILIGPLLLALSSLDPTFKYRNHQQLVRGTSCSLLIKILCLSKYCESWIFHFLVWLWHHHISVEDWRSVLFGK